MQTRRRLSANCVAVAKIRRNKVFELRSQKCYRHQKVSLLSVVVLLVLSTLCFFFRTTVANPDAKRLYDDLMSSYNRLIRPVGNNSDRLTVKMGLKLSQLIDVVRIGSYFYIFCHLCNMLTLKKTPGTDYSWHFIVMCTYERLILNK